MKKFLSLVLALIMTMSLVTISAGATEYKDLTDKDEIEYEEAVAVLNRIGVITGYDDGSFRPETELTRGAAAKIIVSLLIGPEAANNLPNTTAPYPDVPASHTFAGVISYCKTAGIISGYGDGTFKPANSLTGFAFAKMLLGALGYNSQVEGFVDTGWTMNVAKVGNVTGLFDRLDFDGAGAVSREVACQLALNTLKATMVTYGGTTVVTGAQTLAVQGTQAMYVTSNNRDINANINRRVISATNNELTLEFGEEHFKDLRLEHDRYDPAYDIYGHPSNEWSYKKVTIGTFKLPADFTYTKQMAHIEDTVATKEKALDLRGYDTYSTDHRGGYVNWSTAASNTYGNSPFADATQIHINGWKARVWNDDYKQTAVPKGETVKGDGNWYSYDAFDIGAANKDLAPSLSEICDLTDNGVTVEVYVCPVDADFITDVVVTRTQLMEVDRVASDFVDLAAIDSDSKDPRKAGTLTEIAGYNDYSLFDEVSSVKDNNYDPYNVLKDLKAGDEVAVIPYTSDNGKTWEVGEAYVPETVSGALTNVDIYNTRSKADGNAIAITVGGTSYPIAQWNLDMRSISGTKIRATKKDVTLLLDKDGNALRAKDVGASDDWIIVGDYYQATLSSGRVGWYVHGWTIKGDEVDLELGTIRGAAEKYAPGELVRYQVAEAGNGEYELVKPMYRATSPTGGKRVLKNGTLSNWIEPQGDKDGGVQTGQGIYNIAQYAVQGGASKQYEINSRNTLLPLEFYDTDPSRQLEKTAYTATGVHKNYANTSNLDGKTVEAAGDITATTGGFYGTADNYDKWTYRTTPYDGVKFIFVGFDSANGEVDTINVLSGVQSVEYKELTQINRWWKNVGTNGDDFVASPAEAYVDKSGKVKAVVIKSDSAEANLKDLIIITDNRGTNTSVKSGAEAPTSGTYYTRQYVSGEDGFKEEKTGYFDKPLNVGTVITGRLQSDGIVKTRVFHANEYTDRNPDGFYVQGIKGLYTQESKRSDWGFYVGTKNGVNPVYYLGTGVNPGNGTLSDTANILGSKDILGVDVGYDKQGLITVDSTTQFLDLRDGRPGDITELGDLFDSDKCDPSTAILKVLVNGNDASDGFRHAYAVLVLTAKPAADNADAAGISVTARVDGKSTLKDNVAANTGLTEATAWTWTVQPGAEVTLTARVTATGTAQNAKWTNLTTKEVADGNTIDVVAGEDGTTQVLSFYVENYDPDHADKITTPATRYVKIVSKAADTTAQTQKLANKLGFDISYTIVTDGTDSYVNATLNSWPEWVAKYNADGATAATITGVIKGDINGTPIGATAASATERTLTFTYDPAKTSWTASTKITGYRYSAGLKAVEDTTTAIPNTGIPVAGTTEFYPSNMAIKYTGEAAASLINATSTQAINTGAAGTNPNAYFATTTNTGITAKTVAGEGVTAATTGTALTDASSGGALFAAEIACDVNTKKAVEINLTAGAALTTAYSITTKTADGIGDVLGTVASAPSGVTLSTFGTVDTNDAAAVLKLSANKVAGITPTEDVTLYANITAPNAASKNYGYHVAVTINGTTYEKDLTSATDVVLGTFKLSADLEIAKADIVVTPLVKLAVTDATWSGDHIVITFNQNIKQTGNTIDKTFAGATYVWTQGTGTGAAATAIKDIVTTATSVTLYFDQAVEAGNTLAIQASKIESAASASNICAATTLTLGANGVVTGF